MSYSPSILDIGGLNRFVFDNVDSQITTTDEVNQTEIQENATDINDPVTHPFNYAQDRESWYAEVAAAAQEEYRLQKAERQALKKRKIKSKSLKTKSFIMRKESDRPQRIIKIMIHDLDCGNMDEISSDPEDASVNVRYLVTSEYDDIMTETEYLVGKIVKKLSK